MANLNQLYSRFYCTKNNRHRVFPFDSLEGLTDAPVPGKSGEVVLLSSLNSQLRTAGEYMWGFCWACNDWVQCFRRTQYEIMADYLRRRQATIRADGEVQSAKRAELLKQYAAVRRRRKTTQ